MNKTLSHYQYTDELYNTHDILINESFISESQIYFSVEKYMNNNLEEVLYISSFSIKSIKNNKKDFISKFSNKIINILKNRYHLEIYNNVHILKS